MQSITGKEVGPGVQDGPTADQKLTQKEKNIVPVRMRRDPRDVAVGALLAIQEHDPTITYDEQVFIDGAIRACRKSLLRERVQYSASSGKAVA